MAIKSSQQRGLLGFDSESLTKQQGIRAVGGTINDFGNYRVHTFTGSGQFTVIDQNLNIEYLIVGGGGEGGGSHGGGGGGGGVLTSVMTLSKQSYTITIGAGASAGSTNGVGNLGNTTTAFNLSALGGGGGGYESVDGSAGASGGGGGGKISGGASGTIGQGNNGGVGANYNGYGGAGGGGAASVGGNAVQTSPYSAGNGGNGLLTTITGGTAYFGGGGGGAGYSGTNTTPGTGGLGGGGNGGNYGVATYGTSGAVNTGGGSGGFGQAATAYVGLNGGSGIVIIRYLKVSSQVVISKPIVNGIKLDIDASNLYSYGNSGTAWNDISGNANNGTLVNGPIYDAAYGGIITFDGINDWLNLPTSGFGLPALTIDFWVKFNTNGIGGYWWTIADSSGGNPELRLQFTTGNKLRYIWYDTSAYILNNDSQNTLTVGTWYHIVNTTKNNDFKFYINGVIDSALTGVTYDGGTLACHSIGTYNLYGTTPGYGGYVSMSLGSYKFYNRVLTQTEVIQNFNATRNRFGI